MAISDQQLETWSAIGAAAQSKATYATVKTTLERADAPYASKGYTVYLQGSYGNDTNVYRDSDVDVVICTSSVYYSDTSELPPDQKARFESGWTEATYTAADFKNDVTAHLKARFGQSVNAGEKAIFVPGNDSRRDADILACAEFRRYFQYTNGGPSDYYEGVCFFLPDGTRIENYPKMHLANCAAKHQATQNWFKPTVRLFKNMRNRMIDSGVITSDLAPSYFIEGLLYNVPNDRFGGGQTTNFSDVFNWLYVADRSKFICANERFYLLYEDSRVTWRAAKCIAFLDALAAFWNAGG
jgi:hypothetical protein